MCKWLLVIALFPLITSAQVTQTANNTSKPGKQGSFVVTGEIKGIPKGAAVKLINANTSAELASGTVVEKKTTTKKGGKTITTVKSVFVLKGQVSEPDLCLLSVGDLKPFSLYMENAAITITGSSQDMSKWVVKGSSSDRDFREFENTFTPLAKSLNALANSINTTFPGPARDSLMTTYTAMQENVQKEIDSYIDRKKSSYVSPFVLLVMMNFNDDALLAEARFNKLDPQVRNSLFAKALANQIAVSKIGAIGTQALEFSQPDTSGNNVSLSSFRGKYVLVDFWASWCGPCRDENPNVVQTFQKFRDKNFTVLGVSLDKPGQKARWLQAIKDDGLTWTHVSDLQGWESAAAKLYHVQGIPQNFLVDPNGKIVGKNLRGPALEAKLCEILGCN